MNEVEFCRRLAVLLEIGEDAAGPDTEIGDGQMDSLRTLDAIALIDEMSGVGVESDRLMACRRFREVLALVREAETVQAETGTLS